jgi:hypothetical protein
MYPFEHPTPYAHADLDDAGRPLVLVGQLAGQDGAKDAADVEGGRNLDRETESLDLRINSNE